MSKFKKPSSTGCRVEIIKVYLAILAMVIGGMAETNNLLSLILLMALPLVLAFRKLYSNVVNFKLVNEALRHRIEILKF